VFFILGVLPFLTFCTPPDDPATETGAEGLFAPRPPASCDLGTLSKDARAYFPGKGKGSVLDQALELASLLGDDCAAGNAAAYTGHWFQVASLVQGVLASGTGLDPAAGARFLATSVAVKGPAGTPIFAPCGGAADCEAWEGFPNVPNFGGVLASGHGAWAVVSGGTDAVCSSFISPCSGWDAGLRGDAWGVEPSINWQGALHGRTSLVFGFPLSGPSPTGETLIQTQLPAYQWLLIPHPKAFGVNLNPQAVLEVGLCSTVPTRVQELLVQKGRTVLTEATLDWCNNQVPSFARSGTTRWDRMLAFLSPLPAPLVATAALKGGSPGGSAGGFTDFYAVDLPRAALLLLSGQPADADVGQPVTGPGGQPLRIRAVTSSKQSPIENALVHVQVIGNGGLIPSGNGVSGTGLNCTDFACTGRTQADEDSNPGALDLPLVFTKPGQYSMCFTAQLPPLQFGSEVCTEKFNIRP
jgi:hypothetical protein